MKDEGTWESNATVTKPRWAKQSKLAITGKVFALIVKLILGSTYYRLEAQANLIDAIEQELSVPSSHAREAQRQWGTHRRSLHYSGQFRSLALWLAVFSRHVLAV